jgi:hypothetical protein
VTLLTHINFGCQGAGGGGRERNGKVLRVEVVDEVVAVVLKVRASIDVTGERGRGFGFGD